MPNLLNEEKRKFSCGIKTALQYYWIFGPKNSEQSTPAPVLYQAME